METLLFLLFAALIPLTTKASTDVRLDDHGIPVKVVSVEQSANRAPGAMDIGTAKGVVTHVTVEVDSCKTISENDFELTSEERSDVQVVAVKADPSLSDCTGPKKRQKMSLGSEPMRERKPTMVLTPSFG